MNKRVITWLEYKGICAGDICVDCVGNKYICSNFKELPSVNTETIKHLEELKYSLYRYLGDSVHVCGEVRYAFGVADTIINKKIIELEGK